MAFATENFVKRGPEGEQVPLLTMWPRLVEMLRAYEADDLIAVKAGRKVSKSLFDAVIALHWPLKHPDGKVVITSSGNQNISMVLWPEIRRLALHSRYQYPTIPKLSWTGVHWESDERLIVGYSTDAAERAQGVSGNHLLYIIDEASGVEDHIIDAVLGNVAADGCKVVMTSNPTRPSGFFYDAFHSHASEWHGISVRSTESPNIVSGKQIIPGLASAKWLKRMAKIWGEGTPHYEIHVNGNFPPQASNAVIGLQSIYDAVGRWRALTTSEDGTRRSMPVTDDDGPLELGVDVARFGDDESVIAAVRGTKLLRIETVKDADGPTVAGATLRLMRELYRPQVDSRPAVKVDEIGVGASVVDWLAQSTEIDLLPVNVAEVADDQERFANKRAELWRTLAEWVAAGAAIPDDENLQAELATPEYDFSDPKGRMRVESKEQIKRRLKRSPDRADALALAVYRQGATVVDVPNYIDTDRHDGLRRGYRMSALPGRGF